MKTYYRIWLEEELFKFVLPRSTKDYTLDQGWVIHFVISALLDKELTIYGDGKQIRDLLYIADLARAFDLGIKKANIIKGD